MHAELIGQPCRNFNILGSTRLVDPRDGREKVVLSNFAAGATGNLIFVDPETGNGEAIPLPVDEGAWAVLVLDEETLLVGTCPRGGYLHRLDLRSRSWAEPLRDDGETYIWNLCRGDDGFVYGGTYPGCVLLRYDPVAHRLENRGRMSDVADNQYSRYVYAVPGHILVECWSAQRHLTLWNLESHEQRRFGRPGAVVKTITADFICTDTNGELDFYDLHTFEPLGERSDELPNAPALPYSGSRHVIPLASGRHFVVRGQEYFITAEGVDAPPLHPIPTPKPPTRIHTLTAAPDGTIWGACGFGQTIFSCDPASGDSWNSGVVCDQGGEVYGMAFAGDRLFLSAYSGGDHVVYDPAQPWDQVSNQNPKTLVSVGPDLIRPETRSVIGPDGHFWTGWMARYGVYGGGLSRVNVHTGDVTVWSDPIPGQSLIGLSADDRYLYFTTGGKANGLPDKVDAFHFVVWDAERGEIYRHRFAGGQKLGRVLAVAGRVLVCVDSSVHVFARDEMDWQATVALGDPCGEVVALPDGRALIFAGPCAWTLDPVHGELDHVADLPGPAYTATVSNNQVYFAHLTELYRMQEVIGD